MKSNTISYKHSAQYRHCRRMIVSMYYVTNGKTRRTRKKNTNIFYKKLYAKMIRKWGCFPLPEYTRLRKKKYGKYRFIKYYDLYKHDEDINKMKGINNEN